MPIFGGLFLRLLLLLGVFQSLQLSRSFREVLPQGLGCFFARHLVRDFDPTGTIFLTLHEATTEFVYRVHHPLRYTVLFRFARGLVQGLIRRL